MAKITFPDGHVETFDAPASATDADLIQRATQERAIKEGQIQTTWFKGYVNDPVVKKTLAAVVDALPALGAMAGGVMGTAAGQPIAGAMLGAAAGRGGRDALMSVTGVEQNTVPGQIARMGLDAAVTGGAAKAIPAAVEAGKQAIASRGTSVAHDAVEGFNSLKDHLLPKLAQFKDVPVPAIREAAPPGPTLQAIKGMVQAIKQSGVDLNEWEAKFIGNFSNNSRVTPKQLDVLQTIYGKSLVAPPKVPVPKPLAATPGYGVTVPGDKLAFTARETAQGLMMMKNGLSQADAIQRILAQRGK